MVDIWSVWLDKFCFAVKLRIQFWRHIVRERTPLYNRYKCTVAFASSRAPDRIHITDEIFLYAYTYKGARKSDARKPKSFEILSHTGWKIGPEIGEKYIHSLCFLNFKSAANCELGRVKLGCRSLRAYCLYTISYHLLWVSLRNVLFFLNASFHTNTLLIFSLRFSYIYVYGT